MLFYDIEIKSLPKIRYACLAQTEKYAVKISKDEKRLEMCELISGEYIYSTKKNVNVCEAGKVYAFTKDSEGEIYTEGRGNVKLMSVCAELDYSCRVLDSTKLTDADVRTLMSETLSAGRILIPLEPLSNSEFDWITSYIKKIIACNAGERIGEETRAISLWLEMMSRITKACMSLIAYDCKAFSTSAIAYSEMVIAYIMKNYRKKISVLEIAEEFGLTPNYLHAIFKQVRGMTIIDYLTTYRMELAKVYIDRFGLHAYEAAELVGIDDPAYFSRVFKKMYGKSINNYKKGK